MLPDFAARLAISEVFQNLFSGSSRQPALPNSIVWTFFSSGNDRRGRLHMQRVKALAAAAAVAWGVGVLAAQAQKLIAGLDPNKPVTVVANGVETPLGSTNASGELILSEDLQRALDPNKKYVVYKWNCSKFEFTLEGRDEEKCKNQQPNNPQPSQNNCDRCVPVGIYSGGKFTPNSMAQAAGGGSHVARNVGIVAGGIAGALVGVAVAGNDSNASSTAAPAGGTTSQTFTLTGVAIRVTGTPTQQGCPLFGAYTGTGTLTVNASGSGTFTIVEASGVTRTYQITGTFGPNGFTFTSATLNWMTPTARSMASTLSGTITSARTGTVQERHQWLSGGPTTPPGGANCADLIGLAVAAGT